MGMGGAHFRISIFSLQTGKMAMWLVVTVLLVLIVLLDLPRKVYRQYRTRKMLRAIPNPGRFPPDSCHWLLGHIPVVYKQDEELMMGSLEELKKPQYKELHLAKLWMGPAICTVHINNPKALVELLKEPKSEMIYNILVPWLGEGLLIAGGKKWFRNRRLLTPAFHYGILKGYVPVYNQCLNVLLDKWSKSVANQQPVKLFESLSAMSLDIIMQCAFSFKGDCQNSDQRHPYVLACCELIHLVTDRLMNPLYVIDWIYWLSPHGRKMKRVCNLVHQHAENIIAERKEALKNILQSSVVPDNVLKDEVSKTRAHLDFLDILLTARDEEGQGMSDLEIRNEVDTFMFEGHDTTTSAMSWTLYCLAKHPEHQDKVREEVQSVLMGRERLEYDDLKELKYTTWCIKEAMRLYPPVFAFYRKTTDDVRVNNHVIPKGVTVAIEVFFMQHNPHVWDRPEEYDPLRFQPANVEKRGPYDYIPFSAGSRNCIGQNFAMNEMKVVVGTTVSQFSLRLDQTHKVEKVPRVILRTKDDIKVFLEPVGTR